MPGPGYADYQRVSNEAGAVLLNTTYTISNNNVSPAMDTNGYGYINIALQAFSTTSIYYFSVQWFTDLSLSNIISQTFYTAYPGAETDLQLPVIARYAVITFHWQSGNIADQVKVYIFGGNQEHKRLFTNFFPFPFLFGDTVIAAGGSARINPTTTYQGEATWAIFQGASGLWAANLEWLDGTSGNWASLYPMYGHDKGFGGIERVFLPPAPVRMNLFNNDSVAREMVGTLCIG